MYFFGFGAGENERETDYGRIAVQLSTSRQPDGMRSELEKQAAVWIRKDTIQPRRLSANQQAAAVWNAVGWRRCLYGNVSGRLSERTGKDVVFGGCSIQTRTLWLTGTVGARNGIVEIYVLNGDKEKEYLTPNEQGMFSKIIQNQGGNCYVVVDYADYTER